MGIQKIETINTYISDHWGVTWNEMETARDFLQNFYDANNIKDIDISTKDSIVTVSAPNEFDWQELIIFGSDKKFDNSTIGSYGEGFKASLLNAMRNFNCDVTMQIKDDILRFYFKTEKIGKTVKRLIMCDRGKTKEIRGSKLTLKNCPPQLIHEFKEGLNCFFYDNNPLLGDIISKAYEEDIIIYESTSKEGYLFYKNLLRAKLNVPIVMVCNRTYKRVDSKIEHDRDRKSFNDEVMTILLKLALKPISAKPVVEYLSDFWESGDKFLSLLSSSRTYGFNMNFPVKYYAADVKSEYNDNSLISERDELVEEYARQGYIKCPAYMRGFGMKTPLEEVAKNRRSNSINHYTRSLTDNEKYSIDVLSECISELSPFLQRKFKNANYTVGDSVEVIGELKTQKEWGKQEVYLNKDFFTFSFSKSLSILLHEWGHVYGYDGSRTFTDVLTEFIEKVVDNKDIFDDYELRWETVSKLILSERAEIKTTSSSEKLIENLTSEQKSSILSNIPQDELFALIKKL